MRAVASLSRPRWTSATATRSAPLSAWKSRTWRLPMRPKPMKPTPTRSLAPAARAQPAAVSSEAAPAARTNDRRLTAESGGGMTEDLWRAGRNCAPAYPAPAAGQEAALGPLLAEPFAQRFQMLRVRLGLERVALRRPAPPAALARPGVAGRLQRRLLVLQHLVQPLDALLSLVVGQFVGVRQPL